MLLALQCRLKQIFFLDFLVLTGYLASTIIVVPSNLSPGPSPRTRIFLFPLSVCLDELLSTPKITKFLPHSPISNENCERALNLIP